MFVMAIIQVELFVYLFLVSLVIGGSCRSPSSVRGQISNVDDKKVCMKTHILATDHSTELVKFLDNAADNGPLLLMVNNFIRTSTNNLSYFHREFSETEVKSSYFAMSNHYVGHCSLVFVIGYSVALNMKLTNALLSNKIVRPHVDIFVQILKDQEAMNQFIAANFTTNFRYMKCMFSTDSASHVPPPTTHLLRGKSIVVITIAAPEKIRFQNKPDGSLVKGEGVYYEMLQAISQVFNFTFSITSGTGVSGTKLRNGTWVGAVGDIFYGKATIGVMVGTSSSRDGVIDYSATLDRYTRIFYIVEPPKGISWKSAYLPFDTTLWVILLATTILYSTLLYAIFKAGGISRVCSLNNTVGGVVKIFLEQCTTTIQWPGWRVRMLLLLWIYFSLIVGTGYRSKLMCSLTQPEALEVIPRTHEDLSMSGYTLYFRYYGGAVFQYTATSKSPVHKRIFQRMTLVNTSIECVTLALLNSNSACLDYFAAGDYAIASNTSLSFSQTKKLFQKSEDTDFSIGVTWGFRKGSPLTADFTDIILRILGSGLHGQWTEWDQQRNKLEGSRWLRKQSGVPLKQRIEQIYNDHSQGATKLSISSFYGVGFLVVLGISLSWILFALEYAAMHFRLSSHFTVTSSS